MAARRILLGIEAQPQNVAFAQLLEAAGVAEDLGYDSLWVFDHLMPIYMGTEGTVLECWTTLAAIAARTSRIRLGSFVTCNSYRHPGLHAKIGATVDVISRGRLEFGIGAGWAEEEYRAFGIDFPSPGQRIARLAEAIRAIKLLWSEKSATLDGRYYTLADARCEPKPVQRPWPPIWIGGRGERRTLPLVAEEADGWNMSIRTIEEYRHKVEVLAEHCHRIGRDPLTIRRSVHGAIVIRERADELPAAIAAANADGYLQRQGARQIAGTPEQVAQALLPYIALGAGEIYLNARAPYDFESWRLMQSRVAPLLADAQPKAV